MTDRFTGDTPDFSTLMTQAARLVQSSSFTALINPGGPGWKHVYASLERDGVSCKAEATNIPRGILCMVFGCMLVYAGLFATRFWLYGEVVPGCVLAIAAAIAGVGLSRTWKVREQ